MADTKCWYCKQDPEDLKGQKFYDGETNRVFHMLCLQKQYVTAEHADEDKILFFKFQDLIRRVDANWRP